MQLQALRRDAIRRGGQGCGVKPSMGGGKQGTTEETAWLNALEPMELLTLTKENIYL